MQYENARTSLKQVRLSEPWSVIIWFTDPRHIGVFRSRAHSQHQPDRLLLRRPGVVRYQGVGRSRGQQDQEGHGS